MIRLLGQALMLALACFLIYHGITGPQFAPKNLTTLFTWVHYRGLLVLVLLFAGNYFCSVCPMVFTRNLARRFISPRFHWPARWQKKWPAIALFVAVLFAYEALDLWASPLATAMLLLTPFALILLVDLTFKKAAFCKWVCPIGQFNFVASTLSPQEVRVKDPEVCQRCTTYECLRGNAQRTVAGRLGCELDLFLPQKVGNLDCTFCFECVAACPYQNVALSTRTPGAELLSARPRAGIGRLVRRPDLLWLMLVFTMGALLNALGMVAPAYQLQERVGELPGLVILFGIFLFVIPFFILRQFPRAIIPTILPLGFGVWLAHYGFHLFTGALTFIPIVQAMVGVEADFPVAWMGLSERAVAPIEVGFILLGLLGSLVLGLKSHGVSPGKRLGWMLLMLTLAGLALWVMSLPMEMRGVVA